MSLLLASCADYCNCWKGKKCLSHSFLVCVGCSRHCMTKLAAKVKQYCPSNLLCTTIMGGMGVAWFYCLSFFAQCLWWRRCRCAPSCDNKKSTVAAQFFVQWQCGDSGGVNLSFVDYMYDDYDGASVDVGVLKLILFFYYMHWFILFYTHLPLQYIGHCLPLRVAVISLCADYCGCQKDKKLFSHLCLVCVSCSCHCDDCGGGGKMIWLVESALYDNNGKNGCSVNLLSLIVIVQWLWWWRCKCARSCDGNKGTVVVHSFLCDGYDDGVVDVRAHVTTIGGQWRHNFLCNGNKGTATAWICCSLIVCATAMMTVVAWCKPGWGTK